MEQRAGAVVLCYQAAGEALWDVPSLEQTIWIVDFLPVHSAKITTGEGFETAVRSSSLS